MYQIQKCRSFMLKPQKSKSSSSFDWVIMKGDRIIFGPDTQFACNKYYLKHIFRKRQNANTSI